MQTTTPLPDPVSDPDSGVIYLPWSTEKVVGWEAHRPDGSIEYVYLNPSGGSDDGVPTVFLYRGTTGDPTQDEALAHVDVRIEEARA